MMEFFLKGISEETVLTFNTHFHTLKTWNETMGR